VERLVSLVGLFVLVGLGWLLSRDRARISWRLVGVGVALQLLFSATVHLFPPGRAFFDLLREGATRVLAFTGVGSRFIFGDALMDGGGPAGFVFAFQVLPTIIFFSSLMGVLYHLGIMQRVVVLLAKVMAKTMRVSGAESLSAAANIFLGQTEAPLVVRPYVASMTLSELMVLMTGGMATIAGSVLAGYVSFGVDAGHLLAASVMSAPAALVMAKLMIPETESSKTMGKVEILTEKTTVNVIDAAADGAGQGLKLALNVGAMLLAFLALVAMIDAGLGAISAGFARVGIAWFPESLQAIFGVVLWPLAWIMGVPAQDAHAFAALIGEKLTVTEFVAYSHLTQMAAAGEITERTTTIATYALCGFANFGSIAIQLGGIGPLAPERRGDLARLGLRAMVGGALASAMTATIAGLML